ncbi:RNA polymerase II transcription factor B 52 kDa subunit, partial [Kappamyces sp. JEL0680]
LVKELSKYHLVVEDQDGIRLNPKFQLGLHQALTGRQVITGSVVMASGTVASFGSYPETEDVNRLGIAELDHHAITSWENVLHFLVGTTGPNRPSAIIQLLTKSGLMEKL